MNIINTFAVGRILNRLSTNDLCLIYSKDELIRNHDVHYPFRPCSNFQYVCRLHETKVMLILRKTQTGHELNLFKPPYDAKAALWTTGRTPIEQLRQCEQLHHVDDLSALPDYLKTVAQNVNKVYADSTDPFVNNILDQAQLNKNCTELSSLLGKCRLHKAPQEIAKIKQALAYSRDGHINIMQKAHPGINEARLANEFIAPASGHGVEQLAYPSIVAGGKRACILHYNENNQIIHDGELVLVDAGIEYAGYASDITRTFPVNGTFSDAQRQLYEVVLDVQKDAITTINPNTSMANLTKKSQEKMLQNLLDIGFIHGSFTEHSMKNTLSRFFYHGLGHWMGLDVHDPCPYKDSEQAPLLFTDGMVFTVEPGIYVHPSDDIDEKWHHIGIRIEDNILIQDGKAVVLSADIPKEIDEIEVICQKS